VISVSLFEISGDDPCMHCPFGGLAKFAIIVSFVPGKFPKFLKYIV
jgi:hypothetical protein